MSETISPNTTLAHYRILSKIGAGGMGEVYRARDTRLDRGDPLASAKLGVNGVGRNTVTLSPDGSLLVYVGERNGQSQLYRRPLNEFEVKPIPGTEGAYDPFFSPDGLQVGFFAGSKLKRVSLQGGEQVVLCEARTPYGGTWGSDDSIVFGDSEGVVLSRISASVYVPGSTAYVGKLTWVDRQGASKPLTAPAQSYGPIHLSPDGRKVVVLVRSAAATDVWVYDFERGTFARLTVDEEIDNPIGRPMGNESLISDTRSPINLKLFGSPLTVVVQRRH